MKTNNFNLGIAAIVSLGGFLFGFDAAIISGVVGSVETLFSLDDIQTGWVVSSPSFAAMFAMLVAGALSNSIGRKKVLVGVAFLYAVSAIMSAYASSYEMLYIARMIGGLAFGSALIIAPMYIAEISNAENRGKLVSVQQLNIVVGFSVAYFTGYYLNEAGQSGTGMITEDNAWRWMLGVESVPAILYFFFLFFVPRSPRWLLLKGHTEEAKSVLTKLHGEAQANTEIKEIEENLASGNKQKIKLSELLNPALRFVLLVGLVVGVLQQVTGINAVFFYATSIFEQTGIGTNAAFAQSVVVGIINVVFTILVMLLIDKMGRRPLLLIGIGGVAISLLITAYGFHQATYELTAEKIETLEKVDKGKLMTIANTTYDNDLAFKAALKSAIGEQSFKANETAIIQAAANINPYLILFGILGFVASFAFSLGPVMWVLLSELFPIRVRALAIGAIGFVNSFSSWLIQQIFPWELSNLGNAMTFFIYAVLATVGFFLFLKILPETKGKTLEELEKELAR
ncbi:MAG: sugar porter family MFS transporter [Bacteroidota bacterium]